MQQQSVSVGEHEVLTRDKVPRPDRAWRPVPAKEASISTWLFEPSNSSAPSTLPRASQTKSSALRVDDLNPRKHKTASQSRTHSTLSAHAEQRSLSRTDSDLPTLAKDRSRRSTARKSYVPQPIENLSDDEVMYESGDGENEEEADVSDANRNMSDGSVFDEEGALLHENEEDEDFEAELVPEDESTSDGEEPDPDDSDVQARHPVRTSAKPTKKTTNSTAQPLKPATLAPWKKGKGTKASADNMKKIMGRTGKPKGLDTSLPPMSSIEEIFRDIAKKGLDLGFANVTEYLKSKPLRVATMCSGTESPLLALQMIQDALKTLGADDLQVEHVFSAEIVPFKQAYIERNFNPPIIFRDICELTAVSGSKNPVATTAYGAKVPVPTDIDLLIAGTSCVDFSRQNNKKKGLKEDGESADTFSAVFAYCKAYRPSIVIIENVFNAPWDEMLASYDEENYQTSGALVDTKDFYLPHTRQRGYMGCFDKEKLPRSADATDGWKTLMKKFKRLASSPVSAFLQPTDETSLKPQARSDDPSRTVDWSRCEVTQMEYRQEKRLGTARPFTGWQESGAVSVPENSSAGWYRKQVERVLDTIDCSILRKALPTKGARYDARFKTRVWNLSQNVHRDEDSQPFGITGCLTPTGQFYLSDAGRALTAEENMVLQGLPLDRISFTTESPADVADMAGNAMTSTVVGSAILAALIVGHKALAPGERQGPRMSRDYVMQLSPLDTTCSTTKPLAQPLIHGPAVSSLIHKAAESARKCYCEGSRSIAKKPIQQCQDCDHTTCTACGENPAHNYKVLSAHKNIRTNPIDFEEHLRSLLPVRLTLQVPSKLVDIVSSKVQGKPAILERYVSAVQQAASSTFYFAQIRRTQTWTATFLGSGGRLELVIEHGQAEWRLFASPDISVARNDELRRALEHPVARAAVTSSLLAESWELRVLRGKPFTVTVRGSGARVASWFARIGLPDLQQEKVWQRLTVDVPSTDVDVGDYISGRYEYLPACGTACDSLYKRIDRSKDEERQPMYLFLDPDRTAPQDEDCFVFAHQHEHLQYDEGRQVVARLAPKWRPWLGDKELKAADGRVDGTWVSSSGAKLLIPKNDVVVRTADKTFGRDSTYGGDCHAVETIAECELPKSVAAFDFKYHRRYIPLGDVAFFTDYRWAFELMRRHLHSDEWTLFELEGLDTVCRACAPALPQMRWKLSSDCVNIRPYEDTAGATLFERSLKSRPDPMVIEALAIDDDRCLLRVGLNVRTLAHRAIAKLKQTTASEVTVHWKLDTKNGFAAESKFSPFELHSTTSNKSYERDLRMSVKLFEKQKQALAWMRDQEAGEGKRIVLEESEEAVLPHLGWRFEARAQTVKHVRGGICADHPGFGKTITSLALIHAEFAEKTLRKIETELGERMQDRVEDGFINLAATLILCPGTLFLQWLEEIQDKLSYDKEVIAIKTAADLFKRSFADLKKAKIILVNKNVLTSKTYIDRLADFAAVPQPATLSGRSFAEWLRFATEQVPKHLQVLEEKGLKALRREVNRKYQENLGSDTFKAYVPSKRLKGEAYVAGKQKDHSEDSDSGMPDLQRTITDKALKAPLFEMFCFNRIIMDEHHIYEAVDRAAVIALKADKRWALSATPALRDFYDIAKMAALLHIPLRVGSNAHSIMNKKNAQAMDRDLTDVEKFNAMRQAPSPTVHKRIHELDQKFLDDFVRRNIMEYGEFPYADHLLPVRLDIDHRAVYTELSQHLNSQDMRIKLGKARETTDRNVRVNEGLDAESAEEALLKAAAHFDRDSAEDGENQTSGLRSLVAKRELELDSTTEQLRAAIIAAKHNVKAGSKEYSTFKRWKETVITDKSLKDRTVTETIAGFVAAAEDQDSSGAPGKHKKTNKHSAKAEEVDIDDSAVDLGDDANGKRGLLSKVNDLSKRLLVCQRSLRYVKNVQRLHHSRRTAATKLLSKCDYVECSGKHVDQDNTAVSSVCGHVICTDCRQRSHKTGTRHCEAVGCNELVEDYHLLSFKKFGTPATTTKPGFGAKIDKMLDLLQKIEDQGDQAILFVQYESQLAQVKAALSTRDIRATVIDQYSDTGKAIAAFRADIKLWTRSTVIVLNASDESAAGSNLQNANHVIFLSPLLKDSQYGYESTMAQAIGRARRHGQQKDIHVYRFIALDTIDVDILEHRERRTDALVEQDAADIKPPAAAKKLNQNAQPKAERCQLVREDGVFSLRPQSWLVRCGADEDKMEVARVQGKKRIMGWDDYSSLVKFSKTYTDEDD